MLEGCVDGYAARSVHRDEVIDLPEGAVVPAGNAHTAVQAMEYARWRSVLGRAVSPRIHIAVYRPACVRFGSV